MIATGKAPILCRSKDLNEILVGMRPHTVGKAQERGVARVAGAAVAVWGAVD